MENKAVEELFERQNPQDVKCPEWAKQLAIVFSQQQNQVLVLEIEQLESENARLVEMLKELINDIEINDLEEYVQSSLWKAEQTLKDYGK